MRLKDKIIVITGAASGFGKGIAKKFSDEGARLILVDINLNLLKKVSKNLFPGNINKRIKARSNFTHRYPCYWA